MRGRIKSMFRRYFPFQLVFKTVLLLFTIFAQISALSGSTNLQRHMFTLLGHGKIAGNVF